MCVYFKVTLKRVKDQVKLHSLSEAHHPRGSTGAPASADSLASCHPQCWSRPESLLFWNLPVLSASPSPHLFPPLSKACVSSPFTTQSTFGLSFWKATESSWSWNRVLGQGARPLPKSHVCSWRAKAASRWCWKGYHTLQSQAGGPLGCFFHAPCFPDTSRGILSGSHLC